MNIIISYPSFQCVLSSFFQIVYKSHRFHLILHSTNHVYVTTAADSGIATNLNWGP